MIFSIIIPTYNCSELLEETLHSIFCQNKDLFECIIVDGNSKDDTLKTILKYKNDYPEAIKYITENDNGIYDAMNKGIELSSGEYLYFLGAGDILVHNCLDKVKSYLTYSLEMIYGNIISFKDKSVFGSERSLDKLLLSNISHQAIFYRKSIFDILGKYNLKYHIYADYYFNINVFLTNSISKKYIDINISEYRGDGVSDNYVDKDFIYDYDMVLYGIDKKHLNNYIYYGKKFFNVISVSEECAILDNDIKKIDTIREYIAIQNSKINFSPSIKTYLVGNMCDIDEALKENKNIQIISSSNSICSYVEEKVGLKYISKFTGFIVNPKLDIWLKKHDKIVVFGVGSLCERFLEYLNDMYKCVSIQYFIDNDHLKWNSKFNDKYIVNIDDIKDKNINIVIASSWYKDIAKQLESKNMKNFINCTIC